MRLISALKPHSKPFTPHFCAALNFSLGAIVIDYRTVALLTSRKTHISWAKLLLICLYVYHGFFSSLQKYESSYTSIIECGVPHFYKWSRMNYDDVCLSHVVKKLRWLQRQRRQRHLWHYKYVLATTTKQTALYQQIWPLNLHFCTH